MGSTRTSQTHPLTFGVVSCGAGQLGLTLCPGKQGDSVYGAPWARDLETDIRAIAEWGALAVVTLMEAHEFSMLGVPELGGRLEDAGFEWHWLPIPDVSIPNQSFETLWIHAGPVLRARLRAGERVVIHCRGGLGRTGLVAARLLIEFGEDPANAIRAVRHGRPGAIETRAQERYVLDQRPPQFDDSDANRLLGCFLGGAVGDAFGYSIEFDTLQNIRDRFGASGLKVPLTQHDRLIVSDDTQMTLFTGAGVLAAVETDQAPIPNTILEAIRKATLHWFATQRDNHTHLVKPSGLLAHEVLWARRAPGNTCLSACGAGAQGTPETPLNNSKGCGGVMRVAPISFMMSMTPAAAFELAARAAAQTHGHPSGYLSAGVLAALIRGLAAGESLEASINSALSVASAWPGSEETVNAVKAALTRAASPAPDSVTDLAALGEGWVGEEALSIGLYAAMRGKSFAEVLQIAANHDGDSDSTASIAGQIRGAWRGVSDLPQAWIRRLDVLAPVLEITRGLIERCGAVRRQLEWPAGDNYDGRLAVKGV